MTPRRVAALPLRRPAGLQVHEDGSIPLRNLMEVWGSEMVTGERVARLANCALPTPLSCAHRPPILIVQRGQGRGREGGPQPIQYHASCQILDAVLRNMRKKDGSMRFSIYVQDATLRANRQASGRPAD